MYLHIAYTTPQALSIHPSRTAVYQDPPGLADGGASRRSLKQQQLQLPGQGRARPEYHEQKITNKADQAWLLAFSCRSDSCTSCSGVHFRPRWLLLADGGPAFRSVLGGRHLHRPSMSKSGSLACAICDPHMGQTPRILEIGRSVSRIDKGIVTKCTFYRVES